MSRFLQRLWKIWSWGTTDSVSSQDDPDSSILIRAATHRSTVMKQ